MSQPHNNTTNNHNPSIHTSKYWQYEEKLFNNLSEAINLFNNVDNNNLLLVSQGTNI
jgi:hypothetical protein